VRVRIENRERRLHYRGVGPDGGRQGGDSGYAKPAFEQKTAIEHGGVTPNRAASFLAK
jgi:hypothetical protein